MPDPTIPPATWHMQLPDTLTYEDGGKAIPLREHPAIKETADVPTLAKRFFDAHSEMGKRVRMPGKDAKPEEIAAFRSKLTESGIIEAAPASADKYEIAKPEKLPDGIAWNDELAGNFKKTAHALGLTQKQAQGLLAFHAETLGSMGAAIKTTVEEGVNKLKSEWGNDFEAKKELAGRAGLALFRDDPDSLALFEKSGIANHPGFLKVMAKVGELFQEDGTIIPKAAAPAMDEEEKAVMSIMSNPENPDHKKWKMGDAAVGERIRTFYSKKYGNAPAGQPQGASAR